MAFGHTDTSSTGYDSEYWVLKIRDGQTAVNNINVLPEQSIIIGNFPNPFNAITTIRFALPEPQFVNLTIYDLLGRKIRTLVDEHKQAGNHSITFDARNLSTGVYFYRLRAGNAVETKRMVLLK